MADKYGSPFGTYADVTGVVDATAAPEIVALVTELKTFLSGTSGQSMPHPDFDRIPPATRDLLIGEIDAFAAAIAAAPTA